MSLVIYLYGHSIAQSSFIPGIQRSLPKTKQQNLPQKQPQRSQFVNMHSGKSNVAKGPSGNTRSAGKHQDFLNKPLAGRAAKRAEKKQQDKADKKTAANELSKVVKKKEQELKKKAKEYFSKQ